MKELLLTMLLAQGAAVVTTHIGLAGGCVHEGNTAVGRNPAMTKLYTMKVTSIAAQGTIAWGANKSGHKKVAKVVLWTSIGLGAGAATWNTLQIRKGC